jgi:hypothetical protein
VFKQASEHRGPVRLTLDGQPLQEETLKLVNDQREHTVEVLFGPCAVECIGTPSEPRCPAV